MTACATHEPRLDAWLDGELPAAEQQELVDHLQTCDGCRQAHQELQQTKATLGQFFHQLQRDAPAPPVRRLPGWLGPALAAAAMVILALLFRGGPESPLVDRRTRLAGAANQVRDHGTLQVTGTSAGVLSMELGGERLYWEQRTSADAPIRYAGGFDAQTVWTFDGELQVVSVVESEALEHAEIPPWPPAIQECRRLVQQLADSQFAILHVEPEGDAEQIQLTLSARPGRGESARWGSVLLRQEELLSFAGSTLLGGSPWEAKVQLLEPSTERGFDWRQRFPDARPNLLDAESLEALRALGYIDGG